MPVHAPEPVLADVDVAILAGGLGTRLRSVAPSEPKALVDVLGRPFLAHVLDWLAGAGAARVVLCTGYLGDRVRERLAEAHGRLRLEYSQEGHALGTGGALRLALPYLRSRRALVLNGDSFCAADLAALGASHRSRGAAGSIVVRRVANAARFGRVEWERGGRIIAFREKSAGAAARGWINAGIYLLERELIASVPADRSVSLERETFPRWCDGRLFAVPTTAPFIDIGTPASYARAGRFFAKVAR